MSTQAIIGRGEAAKINVDEKPGREKKKPPITVFGNAVKDFNARIDDWLKTLTALHIKAWGQLFATANNATPSLGDMGF